MYELINNKYIEIKEYNGQRVVTFKDIDTVHERPDGTAKRNFQANKEHFIKDVDYFTIELTEYEIRTQFGAGRNAGRTLILLTESGYLMIVKSFTDDLAWSIQRMLVNTYFQSQQKQITEKYSGISKVDIVEEIKFQWERHMEQYLHINQKLDEIIKENQYLKNNVDSLTEDVSVLKEENEKYKLIIKNLCDIFL